MDTLSFRWSAKYGHFRAEANVNALSYPAPAAGGVGECWRRFWAWKKTRWLLNWLESGSRSVVRFRDLFL